MADEIKPVERDVDWAHMASSLEEGEVDRAAFKANLRAIRQIARFNSLIISDQDPVKTLSLDVVDPVIHDENLSPEEPESKSPLAGSVWRHLQLSQLIGKGAHAQVYRALDTRLDREVALKVYHRRGRHANMGAAASMLNRSQDAVIREARLLAKVDHPNVVRVHGADIDDEGRVGIWMDFIRGRTLSEIIREQGAMSAREAELIGIDLCRALAAVHAAGVVHQDVNAQNVMRRHGGRILLMDFGVGFETAESQVGQASGTPLYMAPEVLTTGEASEASDIYSLGVLLFHLVTGRFPIEAEDLSGMLEKHGAGKKLLLRNLRPDLPQDFIDVVEKALRVEPAARFCSMGEMEAALSVSHDGLDAHLVSISRHRRAFSLRRTGLGLVFFVLILCLAWWIAKVLGDEPAIRSLAVLPFENRMGDSEQDFFVEGLHEALITELSKLGALRVISRTTASYYEGTEKTIPEIAGELGVDALVEGSILRVGERVRISAQLIRGDSDEYLWAEDYNRDQEDILNLISEIARSIAEEIDITLSPRQQALLTTKREVDPDVYEMYLRGLHHLDEFSQSATLEARECFQLAIASDPGFALAHVGVTKSYLLGSVLLNQPPRSLRAPALAAARQALDRGPELAEAHAALGSVELYLNWNWDAAEHAINRALELNPNYQVAINDLAVLMVVHGRFDEALLLARRARQCDPYSHLANLGVWNQLLINDRYEELIEEIEAWRDFTGSDCVDWQYLIKAYFHLGRDEEAMVELRHSPMKCDPENEQTLEQAYSEAGIQGAFLAVAEDYDTYSRQAYIKPYLGALYFALAGDAERTFKWLERAYEDRVSTFFMFAQPAFNPYRSDPRFIDLMERVGIPAANWAMLDR